MKAYFIVSVSAELHRERQFQVAPASSPVYGPLSPVTRLLGNGCGPVVLRREGLLLQIEISGVWLALLIRKLCALHANCAPASDGRQWLVGVCEFDSE